MAVDLTPDLGQIGDDESVSPVDVIRFIHAKACGKDGEQHDPLCNVARLVIQDHRDLAQQNQVQEQKIRRLEVAASRYIRTGDATALTREVEL